MDCFAAHCQHTSHCRKAHVKLRLDGGNPCRQGHKQEPQRATAALRLNKHTSRYGGMEREDGVLGAWPGEVLTACWFVNPCPRPRRCFLASGCLA